MHILSTGASATQIRFYHQGRSTAQPEEPSDKETKSASLPTTDDIDLPHLNRSQNVHMTLIDEKPVSKRLATATCLVHFSNTRPWELLRQGPGSRKGDVFSIARIAGITAAKKTPDIVPLCHPGLGLTGVEVDVKLLDPSADGGKHGAMHITATVSCVGRTGVEMEAMTATMGAALTVYDMLKAVDKGMVIGGVKLLEKVGGKSGHWIREEVVKD
ncbi:hypothetical protein BDW74DRAFT_144021, partial [Aspergillus multicolor]|uniref:uncharacterized protein n=1 Tax=Aspergillus multicolor TaxID=41759 RepID=UPI003CCD1BB4